MTVAYLDTSAAMKLVIEQTESEALVAALTDSSRRLAASWLLHSELHCAAGRHPAIIPIDAITAVLDAVSLVDVTTTHPRLAYDSAIGRQPDGSMSLPSQMRNVVCPPWLATRLVTSGPSADARYSTASP